MSITNALDAVLLASDFVSEGSETAQPRVGSLPAPLVPPLSQRAVSEMTAPAEVLLPQEILSTFEEINTAGKHRRPHEADWHLSEAPTSSREVALGRAPSKSGANCQFEADRS